MTQRWHPSLPTEIIKSSYRHTSLATHVLRIWFFFFTLCFIGHVDIAIKFTVPELNTWWDWRTSQSPVPNCFISYFHRVADFFSQYELFHKCFTMSVEIFHWIHLKSKFVSEFGWNESGHWVEMSRLEGQKGILLSNSGAGRRARLQPWQHFWRTKLKMSANISNCSFRKKNLHLRALITWNHPSQFPKTFPAMIGSFYCFRGNLWCPCDHERSSIFLPFQHKFTWLGEMAGSTDAVQGR